MEKLLDYIGSVVPDEYKKWFLLIVLVLIFLYMILNSPVITEMVKQHGENKRFKESQTQTNQTTEQNPASDFGEFLVVEMNLSNIQ
ncbi:hypothetical protein [Salmonella enterica]|uniref:hypothetical protein n=1 Tax=Salmonella enterica TaxID=28901 RepID=UPI00117FA8C6|nr:hypothetical protein [Salmonella enterica]TSA87677.1 hypothetical protein FOL91_24620 [Salmonella enterica subsp. enterica serovar Typhimurium]